MKKERTLKDHFLLYTKGIAMGAADVVPGVSGGTIAFITGIYEELIHSIKVISQSAQKDLVKGKIGDFFKSINWVFLIPLLAGIGSSIILLSKLVLYLLEFHPIPLWSFFFGLIIASTIVVYRKIKTHTLWVILSALSGVVIAYWITIVSPTETRNDLWFIFICGAIAICAMILPGISGSFILLLMGKYEYILTALQELKLAIIFTFMAGCVIGLSVFARFLDWLLSRYHDLTVALLAGFMVGSLNKVWPWKEVLQTMTNSKGEIKVVQDRNILPSEYSAITGNESDIIVAVALALVGFVVVILIEKFGNHEEVKQ
jgi:putative membrane protein